MLVLPMAQVQHGDPGNTYLLAKSIFLATPVTLLFFLPFLLSSRLDWPFWKLYLAGCGLLAVGIVVYRLVVRLLFPESV